MSGTGHETALGFVVMFMAVYFAPWIVACARGHRNTLAIFFLTLLLGWTFIGWVVALVWAVSNSK